MNSAVPLLVRLPRATVCPGENFKDQGSDFGIQWAVADAGMG